jgi:S-formylglutathione hydrolase FrmB
MLTLLNLYIPFLRSAISPPLQGGVRGGLIVILLSFLFTPLSAQSDTTILINNTKIEIIVPKKLEKGTILVLPGWNFPYNDVCLKSDFCRKALNEGFALVLPDMQKSIYHLKVYPQTRADWAKYHTVFWLTDTVIPYIQQEYNLLKENQCNFLFGISTGARGVVMLAIQNARLFKAGAALSGDYDPLRMLNDNLLKGYLGEYNQHADLWKNTYNLVSQANNINIPLFLAHGKDDKVVSYEQSALLYSAMMKSSEKAKHQLNIVEKSGHDYQFWQSQYNAVFEFFTKCLTKRH